jgi:hypothetical protein
MALQVHPGSTSMEFHLEVVLYRLTSAFDYLETTVTSSSTALPRATVRGNSAPEGGSECKIGALRCVILRAHSPDLIAAKRMHPAAR